VAHYFIDGYNVIRASDALSAGALRDQREKLVRFIDEKRPQGSANHAVTVVFDGQPDVSSPPMNTRTRVLFSRYTDADAVIKEQVDALGNPRDAVVVTNDRAIQKWVRGAGAKILSCEEFLAAGAGKPPPRRGQTLDPQTAHDINEELKKLWKLK